MRIIAYLYSDPLLEPTPDRALWGWEVDQVYQDIATEKATRPQLQQLLMDCQTEPASYLLVRRLEELGDSVPEVSDRLAALEMLDVRLVTIEHSPDRPIVADSDLRADLLNLLQAVQTNQRSRRIRQGHARNRVKAMPPPGKAPYGYRRSKNRYVVDRATAPVVKEFFEQFLLYGSLRGAVRHLEKKYGKKISVSTGQRWLTHSVYRGDLEYQTGDVIADAHAGIISRDEAAQIDRLLRRNRRLPSRTASAPRSLAGLVVCETCQSPMTVTRVTSRSTRKATKEYLYLRPTRCPNKPACKAIAYEQILQATIALICDDLPRAVAEVDMPDINQVKQGIGGAIAAKQTILAQLPGLTESGILDSESAELRAYNLRSEIAKLQSNLAQLPPVNLTTIAQAVSIPQFWLDLSEPERRFYFREFIRQIELIRDHTNWTLKLIFIF
ncbi:MAG: recombinase family protein [Phormidesmis sp. CAN_BIN36]|nr:recombinase family protein [Phormidesmis sp. CAN_BIN36]